MGLSVVRVGHIMAVYPHGCGTGRRILQALRVTGTFKGPLPTVNTEMSMP